VPLAGVFIAEEVDGLGDRGSGVTTTVVLQTLLEAFSNVPLRCICFIDEVSFWQNAKL
jgi:hypothetical protein